MPGFRISNVKTNTALTDKYPERCISQVLGDGTAHRQTLISLYRIRHLKRQIS